MPNTIAVNPKTLDFSRLSEFLGTAVVSEVDDGPTKTFTKGQMWTEQPHEHHMISKNASSTEPAKLLVFMIAPHGAQLTTFLP
jgi:quercetin dioxygenase-like cupin family protein